MSLSCPPLMGAQVNARVDLLRWWYRYGTLKIAILKTQQAVVPNETSRLKYSTLTCRYARLCSELAIARCPCDMYLGLRINYVALPYTSLQRKKKNVVSVNDTWVLRVRIVILINDIIDNCWYVCTRDVESRVVFLPLWPVCLRRSWKLFLQYFIFQSVKIIFFLFRQ